MRTLRLALVLSVCSAAGLVVVPASAMDIDEASLDFRLAYFKPTNATSTFDANFGGGQGITFGAGGIWKFDKGLYLEGSFDYYKKSGDKVYVGPGTHTTSTGFGTDIRIIPLTATAGWGFLKHGAVSPYVGGGIGYYFVNTAEGSADNVFGYHIVAGAEFLKKRSFGLAAEVRLSWAPSALGHSGTSLLFNEDDVGGLSIMVKGLWRYKD